MNHPTAIIADDEANLRAGLKIMLEQLWPELDILGEARNGSEALDLIGKEAPDISFLDIRMPGMTGLDVARQVHGRTKVVFITAYDHFAVEAFEGEAVDYVLKPVVAQRLETTIRRLKKHLGLPGKEEYLEARMTRVLQILENRDVPEYLSLIKVKTGSELRFVPVAQVIYFKAEDKYTVVQTAHREFLIKTPIKELELKLDPKQFWRVHRSAIVNIDKIRKIKRSYSNRMLIAFTDIDQTISVSRSYEYRFNQI